MPPYNNYAKTAITATTLISPNKTPKELWIQACEIELETKSLREKSCPKNAFLGLCEEGFLKGIPSGNYTKSVKNKSYAIQAIRILEKNSNANFTPKELWQKLNLGDKKHNSQMDVVLALWYEKKLTI